ncbi:hypothetical protein BHE74_00014861 [Ensete ventricosum]|nr:hypothetical protein GW17_00029302 [Ensete ventricosum]RWW77001.1 hypothetical protein BHE74_00014861 [Ensete ventricosum]
MVPDTERYAQVTSGNNCYLAIPPGSGRSAYRSAGGPIHTARYGHYRPVWKTFDIFNIKERAYCIAVIKDTREETAAAERTRGRGDEYLATLANGGKRGGGRIGERESSSGFRGPGEEMGRAHVKPPPMWSRATLARQV